VGTSGSFIVRAATTTKKLTVATPSEQTAGSAFNVTLTATDEWGNKTTGYTGAKTLAWSGPLGSPNSTAPEYPASATAVTFVEGVGTATAITLYDALSTKLTVEEGTIAGTSAAFTVKAGTAARLGFTTSPSTPTAENTAFATQPKVTVQDAWQNTAATNTSSVTLTPSGATLTCTTNPKPAVAGVATFAGCKMKAAGTYTLTATDGTLTSVLSNSFTIS
jgi:trimeric autotransporter adhesin